MKLDQYKNLVVSGCSFSAGIFDLKFPYNREFLEMCAFVWPHFLLSEMSNETQFYNFAIPGGGNIAAATNLQLFLEKNDKITPQNSLIGFNITELARYDKITSIHDVSRNQDLATRDITNELNLAWVTVSDKKNFKHKIDEISLQSSLAIINLITYLEYKGFRYFFMLMTDSIYKTGPKILQRKLNDSKNNWVYLDDNAGIMEWCKKNKTTVSIDDLHPSKSAHKIIAKQIKERLEK